MPAGEAGTSLTVIFKGGEVIPCPHEFIPATVICPEEAVGETSIVILLVFCPEVILKPVGRFHK